MTDHPGYDQLEALAKKHRGVIVAALAASATGLSAAIATALRNAEGQPTDALGMIAQSAVMANVSVNSQGVGDAIKSLRGLAGSLGANIGASEVGASPVAGGRMQDLLAMRDISIRGLDQTTTDRLSDALRDGLAQGQGYREIGAAMNDALANPSRADMIAITESNRAYNAGALDQYAAAGLTEWYWNAYDGACDDCEDEEGQHSFGDDEPPEHPRCRCWVSSGLAG